MSSRITNADINGAIERYIRITKTLGFKVEGLTYQQGGPRTDCSYRLYVGGSAAPGTINGYIGETKREAYETIHTLCVAFEDVYWTSGLKLPNQS